MTRLAFYITLYVYILLQHASASNDPCAATRNGLVGIKLGMKLSDAIRILGPGRLRHKYENDFIDVQSSYSWTKNRMNIEVNFGKDSTVLSIYLSSKSRLSLIGRIRLLLDSYAQVAREFGVPTIEAEPEFAEGEYVLYDYGYSCNVHGAFEVVFITELKCQNPNMGKCLDKEILRKTPIYKGGIRLMKSIQP